MGHDQIKDHMFLDGLEDAYEEGKLMGSFAEIPQSIINLQESNEDIFIRSLERAKANEDGLFEDEITQITILIRKK